MKKNTIYATMLLLSVVILLGSSCATTSLHSPRPNKPGEVSLGLSLGYIIVPEAADTEGGVPLLVNAMGRIGLFDQAELGINAGSLGGNISFKYGLFPFESAFQLSFLGGAGLYLWNLPDFDIGALVGYSIADIVMPYAGFRQHLLVGGGVLPYGNIIGGIQVDTKSVVSFMVEFDHTLFYLGEETFSDAGLFSFDPNDVALPVINAGIVLTF